MVLRLIEGLISSPLVLIRRRNGGKAGGFLTAGTAALGAPVPSNWVRQSGASGPLSTLLPPPPFVAARCRLPRSFCVLHLAVVGDLIASESKVVKHLDLQPEPSFRGFAVILSEVFYIWPWERKKERHASSSNQRIKKQDSRLPKLY